MCGTLGGRSKEKRTLEDLAMVAALLTLATSAEKGRTSRILEHLTYTLSSLG